MGYGKSHLYIRWMGAYRKTGNLTLSQMLKFEITRTDEAAGEMIRFSKETSRYRGTHCDIAGYYSDVARISSPDEWRGKNVRFGVLVKESSVFRRFENDCNSFRNCNGVLCTKTPHRKSYHTEFWAHMDSAVEGLVVFRSISEISKQDYLDLTSVSKKFNLPIWELRTDGTFVKVKEGK